MIPRRAAALFAAFPALVAAGCRSPTGPTHVQPAPRVVAQILGIVTDATLTKLAGVRVEIVDGPSAGAFAISDLNGRVSFVGAFTGVLTFRAAREGYLSATQTLNINALCSTCQAQIVFEMLPADVIAILGLGAYSLTVVADSSCTGLPAELRTRSYSATITRSSFRGWYDVRVPGMLFEHGWFLIRIDGNDLVTDDDSYPTLFEPLSQFAYLGIDFAFRQVFEARESMITVRFPGTFEYCVLASGSIDIGFCERVPSSNLLAHERCDAEHHQMIFVRRE